MNSHELAKKLLEQPNIPVYYLSDGDLVEVIDIQQMDNSEMPDIPVSVVCLIGAVQQ